MKDFILEMAQQIAEGSMSLTPSYNDVLSLMKVWDEQGVKDYELPTSPDEYEQLDDERKKFINLTARLHHKPSYEEFVELAGGVKPDMMDKEEYDALPDEEKWNICNYLAMAKIDTEADKPLDSFDVNSWFKEYQKERDEDGYLPGKKPVSANTVTGDNNYVLFVCEDYVEYGDIQYLDMERGHPPIKYQKEYHPYKKVGAIIFKTKEEAEAEMNKRIDALVQKYGIDRNGFKKYEGRYAVPKDIAKADPTAYAVVFNEIEGEGKKVKGKPGRKTANSDDDEAGTVTFDKKTKRYFFEYFVYKSNTIIKAQADDLIELGMKIKSDGGYEA